MCLCVCDCVLPQPAVPPGTGNPLMGSKGLGRGWRRWRGSWVARAQVNPLIGSKGRRVARLWWPPGRVRLRGTSVPAGEQPPSQLPSFLSDTHLLHTQTWQRWSPPPESRVASNSERLTGPKARIWLEKDKSFTRVSFPWESGCLASDVEPAKSRFVFQTSNYGQYVLSHHVLQHTILWIGRNPLQFIQKTYSGL